MHKYSMCMYFNHVCEHLCVCSVSRTSQQHWICRWQHEPWVQGGRRRGRGAAPSSWSGCWRLTPAPKRAPKHGWIDKRGINVANFVCIRTYQSFKMRPCRLVQFLLNSPDLKLKLKLYYILCWCSWLDLAAMVQVSRYHPSASINNHNFGKVLLQQEDNPTSIKSTLLKCPLATHWAVSAHRYCLVFDLSVDLGHGQTIYPQGSIMYCFIIILISRAGNKITR